MKNIEQLKQYAQVTRNVRYDLLRERKAELANLPTGQDPSYRQELLDFVQNRVTQIDSFFEILTEFENRPF